MSSLTNLIPAQLIKKDEVFIAVTAKTINQILSASQDILAQYCGPTQNRLAEMRQSVRGLFESLRNSTFEKLQEDGKKQFLEFLNPYVFAFR